jgi:putative exporter of polyketide antibiotics
LLLLLRKSSFIKLCVHALEIEIRRGHFELFGWWLLLVWLSSPTVPSAPTTRSSRTSTSTAGLGGGGGSGSTNP